MSAKIKLNAASGGGSVSLEAPTSTTNDANVEFKLPNTDGSAGQVLQTDGNGNLSWTTPATANAAFSMLDTYILSSTKSISAGSYYILNADFDRRTYGSVGTGLTKSGQYFSFPSTGIYMLNFRTETRITSSQSSRYVGNAIYTTTDNTNYTERVVYSATPSLSNATYNMNELSYVFDVVNLSNDKFYLAVQQEVDGDLNGSSNAVQTQLIVYKMAET